MDFKYEHVIINTLYDQVIVNKVHTKSHRVTCYTGWVKIKRPNLYHV